MDFLNKSFQQIADVVKSMTPGARITAGLLLGVIVISLVFLTQFTTIGGDEFLFGGREFSQGELADMEAAFGSADLGEYEVVGNRVKVARGKKQAYLGALADANALPDGFNQIDKGATSDGGLIPQTRAMQQQQYKQAQEQNLSLIIREMRGIEYARVKFETEQKPGLRNTTETRAVAAVRAAGNKDLTDQQVSAIRNTVVAGIAGLKPENVTITDWNGGQAYQWTGGGSFAGVPHSEYIAHKQHHEKIYRDKILERLRNYPGVVVEVDVELESVLSFEEATQQSEGPPAALPTSEGAKSTTTGGSANGEAPGLASHGGNANSPAAVTSSVGGGSNTADSSSGQDSVSGSTLTKKTKPGLVPTRVTTSIGIPRSYYVRLWHEHNKPPAGETARQPDPAEIQRMETETKDNIHQAVVTLIPKPLQGQDSWDHIIVQTDEDLAVAEVPEPGISETATIWLAGNWQTIGMLLFGVFSLLMLRGMVRGTSNSPLPTQAETPQPQIRLSPVAVDAADDEQGDNAEVRPLRLMTGEPESLSELARLVKEDPDSAARVLKKWLGEAA